MELEPLNIWAVVFVLGFIAVAVYTDLKWLKIPNWLTVTAFALGLLFHTVSAGWSGLLMSLAGFGTGFGLLFLLWLIGGGGGGDVKLMGAVGAWVGALPVLAIFIASAVFAVVCTIAMMMFSKVNGATLLQASPAGGGEAATSVRARNNPLKQHIPYAVPVAMAAVCVIAALQLVAQ